MARNEAVAHVTGALFDEGWTKSPGGRGEQSKPRGRGSRFRPSKTGGPYRWIARALGIAENTVTDIVRRYSDHA